MRNDHTEKKHPYEIGKNYLVKGVTMIDLGRLVAIYENELVLENASWIADTGRFNEALSKGIDNISNSEIERYNKPCIVGRNAIVGAVEYIHELPKVSK